MIWFRRTVVTTEGGFSIFPLIMAIGIVCIGVKYGAEIVRVLIVIGIIIGSVMGLFGSLIMARGVYLVDKKYRIHRRVIRTVKRRYQRPINADNTHIIEPTRILNRQEFERVKADQEA